MIHTSAEILAHCLISIGIFDMPSQAASWPLYIAFLPARENGNDSAVITETTGVLDGRYADGVYVEHYGSQLRVRSLSYSKGYLKTYNASLELNSILNTPITLDGVFYRINNVSRTSSVIPLGVEENGRGFSFSVNFLTTITQE
ncbi:MAG: hypothetical protein PHI87_04865 [Candidatus Methanomethylophilus sp.]|nr:hypothetical protein [Methanomethylophilus sp.]